jgi:hypothetical protein
MSLTLEDFTDLVDHSFPVTAGDHSLGMTLVEAKTVPGGVPGGRQPFSLLFRGPQAPALPQAMYAFEHPRHGVQVIFIVPVGSDAGGRSYEAIFS